MPIDVPAGAGARTHVVLAGEHTDPIVVPRASVAHVLVGAAELFAEIAAADDGQRYAVLIAINGWIQVCWIDLTPLSVGGAA